ncbi:YncE family protein, partial [Candidatus Omnitrophota bacterium]
KMYTIGLDGDTVDEYNLSTAWDVLTAVYSQEEYVNAKEASPTGLFFKPDGLKMYTIGYDGDTVDEYNLSTAWDVDSANYSQEISVNAKEVTPLGLFFKPDGLKMYTIGQSGKTVDEYNLSTAWDVDSATYSQEISVNAKETFPEGVFFKPDGLKMYTMGDTGKTVDEYNLGGVLLSKVSTTDAGFTAGNPYTSGVAIDYTVQAGDVLSPGTTYYWRVRAIDPGGSNTYGAWSGTRSFIMNTSPTVALNTPADAAEITDTTPTLNFTGTDADNDDVEYNVQVGDDMWDVTTATYSQEISVNAKEATPTGLFFKPDGLKMYTIGLDGDTVDEYNLSVAWDVLTATYSQEISVNAKETWPEGLFFKPDGLKMYTIGNTGKTVDEYNLSTAWDVDSALYSQEISVSAKEASPAGLFFKPDGLKMYTIGTDGKTVDEYNLSVAWSVLTATYSQEKSVSEYQLSPTGVFFTSDGLKMYTVGATGATVDEYNLSVAWDVTTATYSQEISVNAYSSLPEGVFFKPDGLKMYTIGASGKTVDEYDLVGTALIDKVSTADPGFTEGNPYTSGVAIDYTVQAGSALSGGDYFWRVRAIDPGGVNVYGAWSTRSFAIKPDAPTNVAATDGDHTDKVTITWTKSTGATGYKVYEGSNVLDTLGDVATYDDTLAAAPTITPGTADATDGTSAAHVALSLSGQSTNNGASRTYKVVAFNGAGDSPDSSPNDGYRGVGALTYQWQRSAADSDENYSNITDATTEPYNDTGAVVAPDGRFYRCVEDATGATQQISSVDRGNKNGPPTVALNTPADAAPITDLTPTLNFTGTDAETDDVEYNVQVGTDNTFTAWDVTTATYSQETSVSVKEVNPTGLFFKSDGLKMYTIGYDGGTVDEYNLSVAWDVTTASYSQEISVGAKDTWPMGLFFKPDGLKMYTAGQGDNTVDEYNLSVAWDVSTATYSQETDVGMEETGSLTDLFFKSDGTKMYIVGLGYPAAVGEYDLSVAWDVTSASYSQKKDLTSYEIGPTGLFFKPDGLKMYTIGVHGGTVDGYSLSVAWDVTTATYSQEISVSAQEVTPTGLFFKPDGLKMYTIGSDGDTVDEYNLGGLLINEVSTTDPGFTADNPYTSGVAIDYTVQAGDTLSTGTTYYWRVSAIDPSGSNTYGAWSGTRSFTTNTSPTVALNTPADAAEITDTTPTLNFTGTDSDNDDVEYNVQVGDDLWDVTTATYSQEIGVNAKEPAPTGLFFKPDGTKMYTIGDYDNTVDEYSLSVAWDVTTATYSQEISVNAQDIWPRDLFFKSDGTKMYTIGSNGD